MCRQEQRQHADVAVDAAVRNLAVAEEADQRHFAELVLDRREIGRGVLLRQEQSTGRHLTRSTRQQAPTAPL